MRGWRRGSTAARHGRLTLDTDAGDLVAATLRRERRRLLASLIRLASGFDRAEDALQEACARALSVWPAQGVPAHPAAWLLTVARRLLIDGQRQPAWVPLETRDEPIIDTEPDPSGIEDDQLRLLYACCHPALALPARCALALRTLGGLSTREIARAFIEPEATTAQRIVRARRKIEQAGIGFEIPAQRNLPERTDAVLAVLYLIFNEGHTATEADSLQRPDLAAEAIRLMILCARLVPEHREAQSLLALMLLTDARRDARVGPTQEFIPLERQDRSHWNRAQIDCGVAVLDATLARLPGPAGPYALQAAIAALHATAPSTEETDWLQIALLYQGLLACTANPVIELNAAVAHGLAHGLESALRWIEHIDRRGHLAGYHLLHAARADLLRRLGREEEAAQAYRKAMTLTRNGAERRYLGDRLAGLGLAR